MKLIQQYGLTSFVETVPEYVNIPIKVNKKRMKNTKITAEK